MTHPNWSAALAVAQGSEVLLGFARNGRSTLGWYAYLQPDQTVRLRFYHALTYTSDRYCDIDEWHSSLCDCGDVWVPYIRCPKRAAAPQP